jgi:hypothetical protein
MSPDPLPPEPTPSQQYKEKHTYIPPRVERAMAQRMQQTLPAHMKKYTEAYIQQNVASHDAATPGGSPRPEPSFNPHPAMFHKPYQTVSDHVETQSEPAQSGLPEQSAVGLQGQQSPAQPPQPPANPPGSPYDFMTMNPEKPSRKFSLPGGSSLASRALVIGGGLLMLFIIFAILKSLFGSGSDFTPFISVAQDQQELVHLTTAATQQQGISTASQNFAATTQLTIGSAQANLIKYLATNHKKVSSKVLILKVSASTDSQLQAAIAATTYDETFQQVMKNELGTYMKDMQQVYNQTKGKKGRTLLRTDYQQAQLLLTQLNEPRQ